MGNIAGRFLRKAWLWKLFDSIRDDLRASGRLFPGDLVSPPDIHGEYLPTSFLPTWDGVDWRSQIADMAEHDKGYADEIAQLLTEGGAEFDLAADDGALLDVIDSVLEDARQLGLAHTLAEAGYLPMYGMPTRIRQMYLGLRYDGNQASWSTVDRDVDLAIYEFAPGSSLIIDKREHVAIGFTPDLSDPIPGVREQSIMTFQDTPFGASFRMIECGVCRAWARVETVDEECEACGSKLQIDLAKDCRVPNAFRTDLPSYPRTGRDEGDSGVRHRSIQAEGSKLDFKNEDGFGPSGSWTLAFAQQTGRTFRLNRGGRLDDGEKAFELRRGHEVITPRRMRLDIPRQSVSTDPVLSARVSNTFQPEPGKERIWLAAPKVTEALYLAAETNRPGLAFQRLPGRVDSGTPARGDCSLARRSLGCFVCELSRYKSSSLGTRH